MGKTNYRNPFTAEEIEQLQANPNVLSVSRFRVMYTPEFKKYFCERRSSGTRVHDIFEESGIDTKILGESRLMGFSYTMNKQARQKKGFKNRREKPPRVAEESTPTLEDKVRQLDHLVAYMQQELEFLKKIQMANMEARKSWESKRRPE